MLTRKQLWRRFRRRDRPHREWLADSPCNFTAPQPQLQEPSVVIVKAASLEQPGCSTEVENNRCSISDSADGGHGNGVNHGTFPVGILLNKSPSSGGLTSNINDQAKGLVSSVDTIVNPVLDLETRLRKASNTDMTDAESSVCSLDSPTVEDQKVLGLIEKPKAVTFSNVIHVVLIPSRAEMKRYFDGLYYYSENYKVFKDEAIEEIKAAHDQNGFTYRECINFLYQPANIQQQDDRRKELEEIAQSEDIPLCTRSKHSMSIESENNYSSDTDEVTLGWQSLNPDVESACSDTEIEKRKSFRGLQQQAQAKPLVLLKTLPPQLAFSL